MPPEALRSQRSARGDPAAARRAAQERAGRASVRAAGLPVPPERRTEAAAMFAHFILALRQARRARSRITEYLALLGAVRARRRRLQRRRFLLPGARHAGEGRAPPRPLRPRVRRVLQGARSRRRRRPAARAARGMAAQARREAADRGGEGADRGAGRLGEADGDAAPAPRGAEGAAPGRQQVDRHRRHLAVRRLRLQPGRRAHRPGQVPRTAAR